MVSFAEKLEQFEREKAQTPPLQATIAALRAGINAKYSGLDRLSHIADLDAVAAKLQD